MIKPYGFFIALGLFFIYFFARTNAKKHNLSFSSVESALIWGFIGALVGARLYHVFSSFSYYLYSPLKIFFVWEGGLGIFGAILGGITGIVLYSKLKHLDPLNFLNIMAPPLLLAQAIGRLGNFFNHEGFGPPTNLLWKVYIPITHRPSQFLSYSYFHPTFFYESFLCLLAFIIFILLPKKIKESFGLAYYLAAYGLVRLFTESLRLDTWKAGNLPIGYLLATTMILTGTFLLIRNKVRLKPNAG